MLLRWAFEVPLQKTLAADRAVLRGNTGCASRGGSNVQYENVNSTHCCLLSSWGQPCQFISAGLVWYTSNLFCRAPPPQPKISPSSCFPLTGIGELGSKAHKIPYCSDYPVKTMLPNYPPDPHGLELSPCKLRHGCGERIPCSHLPDRIRPYRQRHRHQVC